MKKILCFKDSLGQYEVHSRRLHNEFIPKLYRFFDFNLYGPKEHEFTSNFVPLVYDKNRSIEDVIREINPDIILVHTYVLNKWLPSLKNVKNIPVIYITGDYCDEYVENFCKFHNIDYMIHRNLYDKDILDYEKIPYVWLPWAATSDFYTTTVDNYLENRINKIVFIGSSQKGYKYYKVRRIALDILEKSNILERKDIVGYIKYPYELKQYIGGLSCTGDTLHTPYGKIFEIMASGTALLTQWFHKQDVLFGKEQCFFTYKDDCSNIVSQANIILNDIDQVKEVTQNALSVINKYHLEHYRLLEFRDILNAFIEGKEVPKRWGT